MFLVLFLLNSFSFQSTISVKKSLVKPLDFQTNAESYTEYYLPSIDQIETNGTQLFLRSIKSPNIVVLNEQGQVLKVVGGKKGAGPGEFVYGIRSIGITNNHIYAWDGSESKVVVFSEWKHTSDFRVKNSMALRVATSNSIAVNNDFIVLPNGGFSEYLGNVYKNGTFFKPVGNVLLMNNPVRHINTLVSSPLEPESKLWLSFFDTLWTSCNGKYFCLSKYYPILFEFDEQFELKKSHELEIDTIFLFIDEIFSDEMIRSGQKKAMPLFSDFQVVNNIIYLMAQVGRECRLFKYDLEKGKLVGITVFIKNEEHSSNKKQNVPRPLCLPNFRILNSGSIILGNPVSENLWGHDLWQVKSKNW